MLIVARIHFYHMLFIKIRIVAILHVVEINSAMQMSLICLH